MNKRISLFFTLVLFITACKQEHKQNEQNQAKQEESKQQTITPNKAETVKVDTLEMDLPTQDKLILDNGIEIEWLMKTEGAEIKQGDVILIDYKVRLEDSTIIDGNHLLKMPSLPYMYGFGFQPKGWDIAISHLRVGDFARIKIPAKLARGNQEIKNLVPKNADNYLTIRILSKKEPTRIVDGTKVWLLKENKSNEVLFNKENNIIFHTTISSPSKPFYFNSYIENQPYTLQYEDRSIVPGLKKALINAKKGDRMYVLIPADEAYGSRGYLNIVKPNEDLFYNILVMDVFE